MKDLILALALLMLSTGVCPPLSSADQADTEEILSLKKQIRANPNDAVAHSNLGFAYRKLGKHQEAFEEYLKAVKEYEKAIRIKPDDAKGHNNLGLAYFEITHDEEAAQEFKEAIRIKPDYTEAHFNLGDTYITLGNYQEAVKELKESIRLNPDDALAHYSLGRAKRLGKDQEAQALRINPDDDGAFCNQGYAHLKHGEYARYEHIPNNAGIVYALFGMPQNAIQQYDRAIRINPEFADAYCNLGAVYFKLGKNLDAFDEFKKAIRIMPDYIEAHYKLGATYDALKDGSNAIVHTLIAAKLFEKAGDNANIASANKSLRELYAKYGYKSEDFASVKIPDNNKAEGQQAQTTQPTQPPKQGKTQGATIRALSSGTGILFNATRFVFTNYHVVRDAKHIKVKFVDGETILAGVSYADESNDIAMLTLAKKPKIQLKRIPLADTSKARIGEKVFTIGYPASHILGKEPKYSEGVINSLSGVGDDAKMFQISVPIQAGNSGGPLFNEKGEVIGLITSTFVTNEALMLSGTMPQNVNFAVKSSLFADKALSQSKGIATTAIVPVPVPFSVPDFVAGVKNNIVLIEAE